MNKFIGLASLVGAGVMAAMPVMAATNTLQNMGISQRAGDIANFGIAVCNKGTTNLSGTVTVAVRANGMVQNPSVGPLAAGACTFTYLSYASFNMVAGQTYQVEASIDAQRLFAQNSDTLARYSITVPSGVVLGASTVNVDAQRDAIRTQLASLLAVVQSLQKLLAQMQF